MPFKLKFLLLVNFNQTSAYIFLSINQVLSEYFLYVFTWRFDFIDISSKLVHWLGYLSTKNCLQCYYTQLGYRQDYLNLPQVWSIYKLIYFFIVILLEIISIFQFLDIVIVLYFIIIRFFCISLILVLIPFILLFSLIIRLMVASYSLCHLLSFLINYLIIKYSPGSVHGFYGGQIFCSFF